MRTLAFILAVSVWLAHGPGVAEETRAGKVIFSDGREMSGNLSLPAGAALKLQAGPQVRTFAFPDVRELRFTPQHEELAQKWRFLEAGQARKVKEGEPYPVRELEASVTLANNQTVTGHLYTTVLLLETPERTEKVLLQAKQRGREGETLASLVFPARIVLGVGDEKPASDAFAALSVRGLAAASEVCALSRGALERWEGKRTAGGDLRLAKAAGPKPLLAAKAGATITVGWPKTPDPGTTALVRAALPLAEDFFDDRRLLAVWRDHAGPEAYSLVLDLRRGKTTLEAQRSQPWRVVVLRWKFDPDSQTPLLAGQNYFFRGILAPGEPPPAVELSDRLWDYRLEGDSWVARGPEQHERN
jgi:hypothetical protein